MTTAIQMSELVRYLVVGGLVTLADMFVYNALAGPPLRFPRVLSNTVSVTAGMLMGFTCHLLFVFQPAELEIPARVTKYVVTVAISVYGVQNLVIFLLAAFWRVPLGILEVATRTLHLPGAYSVDFLERMTGKAAAAAAGVVWNYVAFKFYVYA